MTVKERITALREVMAEKKIDAYLVPTDDFHASEYVGENILQVLPDLPAEQSSCRIWLDCGQMEDISSRRPHSWRERV